MRLPSAEPTPAESGDILELTDQDLLEQATVRYGDRYELLSLVGAGAYGSVYRARDSELDEIVAVKVLRRECLSQPGALSRFRREVRLARRVAHPNVARTYDIGTHKGERFLTMEYIDGPALTRLSPPGLPVEELLPIRIVIDIAAQLCAGLGALHAAGIIHRDMKTDNVLVGHDGRVAITDFGIARALQDPEMERPGAAGLTGTPAYMSPEQVRGNGEVDTRADLFSLGVILFQLLTGRFPFGGETAMGTALARLYEAPVDPRSLREQLPLELAKLVLRCLEREPDERFQTADELSTSLCGLRPAGPELADFLQARRAAARGAVAAAGIVERSPESGLPAGALPTVGVPIPAATQPPHLGDPAVEARLLAVAVLLFRFQGDAADEYLNHGLTEELIDRISESEGLRVVSYGVVRSLGGDEREPTTVGRQLHAQVVLDGSLRVLPQGGGVLAVVRLISVDTGLQFAVRRFERADRNVVALAGEIAVAICSLLTVKLSENPIELASDPAAVDLYLRAREQYNHMTPAGASGAVALFRQALERVPKDPTLLTGYATALARQWFFGGADAAEHVLAAAERAVQAAPDRGEPYLALANMQVNASKLTEAAASLCRALTCGPRLAEAHELIGHLLAETGPLDVAIRRLTHAMVLDRSVPRVRFSLARCYALDGQREAAEALLSSDGIDPAFAPILWAARVRLHSWFGNTPAAQALLREPALQDPRVADTLARLQLLCGKRKLSAEEYVPAFHRAATASPRARLFGLQLLVEYHLLAGQVPRAWDALREVVELGLADLLWLDRCPLLAPLRRPGDFALLRLSVFERALRVRRAFGLADPDSDPPPAS